MAIGETASLNLLVENPNLQESGGIRGLDVQCEPTAGIVQGVSIEDGALFSNQAVSVLLPEPVFPPGPGFQWLISERAGEADVTETGTALSVTYQGAAEVTATMKVTAKVTPEPTSEITPEVTSEVTAEITPEVTVTIVESTPEATELIPPEGSPQSIEFATPVPPTDQETCRMDVNYDGVLNQADLTILLSQYGSNGLNNPADVNDDKQVNLLDYAALIEAMQNCEVNTPPISA